MTDIPLAAGTIKRPDMSYAIRPRALPNPPPPWIKYLPDGFPCPSVVIEIAVNNDSPQKMKDDCHRYFANTTSVCLWVGVKVWTTEKKFWVGWAERAPAGNRAIIHSDMALPPHHSSIEEPVNVIYHIPMLTIYGNGITIPQNTPPALDIDCDNLRAVILEYSP
jgi:hypothetical protein